MEKAAQKQLNGRDRLQLQQQHHKGNHCIITTTTAAAAGTTTTMITKITRSYYNSNLATKGVACNGQQAARDGQKVNERNY